MNEDFLDMQWRDTEVQAVGTAEAQVTLKYAPAVVSDIPLITVEYAATVEVSVIMRPHFTQRGSFTLYIAVTLPETAKWAEPFVAPVILNSIAQDPEFKLSGFMHYTTLSEKYVVYNRAMVQNCAEALAAYIRRGSVKGPAITAVVKL